MITLDDYFMGRDRDPRFTAYLTPEIVGNAQRTVQLANLVLARYYADHPAAVRPRVSSGWRPPAVNAALEARGAAPQSKHMTGEAIDLSDGDGPDDDRANDLAAWCVNNALVLEACGLWMEDPRATPTWVHWQIVPPKSGRRYFIPDAKWAARLAGNALDVSDLERA